MYRLWVFGPVAHIQQCQVQVIRQMSAPSADMATSVLASG